MMQFKNVDEYISSFPPDVQLKLQEIRSTIAVMLPGAAETISYGLATFKYRGKNLVHFGGFKHHVGFYPGASGVANFQDQLQQYKTSKGAIQFPLTEALPLTLIRRIVQFRIRETDAQSNTKKKTHK